MVKITAYPNYDAYLAPKPVRDLNKWTQAARDLFFQVHKGILYNDAFNKVTSQWEHMERLDFFNWLKFYEEGGHKKYAQAVNYWENAERAGYFVPIYPTAAPTKDVVKDLNDVKDPETHPDVQNEERRDIIEYQRNKIIGRLDSAEKLLRSRDGQMFAGKELESILDSIYQLKKKIQMINKISLSTTLYVDMIIREANILTRNGFVKAASMLEKIAQSAATPGDNLTSAGLPGNLPGEGPGLTPPGAGPTDTAAPTDPSGQDLPIKEEDSEGMKAFLEGLETNNDTFEVDDEEDDENLVSEAQSKDFDQLLDSTFANLTVADVVVYFEELAKIFKVREIPRRLSYADMMLDHLGFAPFFPSMAEATNKSLESNQYISTRVEEILSRLRGTLATKEIDLKNDNPPSVSPQTEEVKNKLEDSIEKEKARKQMRKNIENETLMAPDKAEAPNVEMEEDLKPPTQLKGPVAKLAPPGPIQPPMGR